MAPPSPSCLAAPARSRPLKPSPSAAARLQRARAPPAAPPLRPASASQTVGRAAHACAPLSSYLLGAWPHDSATPLLLPADYYQSPNGFLGYDGWENCEAAGYDFRQVQEAWQKFMDQLGLANVCQLTSVDWAAACSCSKAIEAASQQIIAQAAQAAQSGDTAALQGLVSCPDACMKAIYESIVSWMALVTSAALKLHVGPAEAAGAGLANPTVQPSPSCPPL